MIKKKKKVARRKKVVSKASQRAAFKRRMMKLATVRSSQGLDNCAGGAFGLYAPLTDEVGMKIYFADRARTDKAARKTTSWKRAKHYLKCLKAASAGKNPISPKGHFVSTIPMPEGKRAVVLFMEHIEGSDGVSDAATRRFEKRLKQLGIKHGDWNSEHNVMTREEDHKEFIIDFDLARYKGRGAVRGE